MKILSKLKSLCEIPLGFGGDKLTAYITTQAQLDSLVRLLRNSKLIALDTEFTRQTTYYPILSIIQIAVKTAPKKKEFFIIDAQTKIDLSEFFQLMNEPQLIKIIHSSSQDLQILHHESNLVPHGIMDTQLMANLCGIGCNMGYSGLVEKFLGKKVDKKQQNSDWQQRPLHKKQISYALSDVSFLEEIYEKLYDTLQKKNRLDWYFEEIKTFTNKSLFRSDENLVRKIPLKGKTSRQIFQIKNLISWREKKAQEMDIPRQHLLRDEVIERLVDTRNTEYRFPKRFDRKMSNEASQILNEEGEQSAESHNRAMSESQKKNYETAKKLIHKIAAEENIESQFLLSAPDLKQVISQPESLNEKIVGWRYQLFGSQIQDLQQN